MLNDFPPCAICGTEAWTLRYEGPVRDGPVGRSRLGRVARCGGCRVDRLAESLCLRDADYAGGYRDHVAQGHDLDHHYDLHDQLARFTLEVLWPRSPRGLAVADVGCGGGSLLDHVRGLAGSIVAIDPDQGFAPSLIQRGYAWYASAADAAKDLSSRIDLAFSIQVIEHVDDPRSFLADIRSLLVPEGLAIVSTPNRADILLELLPEDFAAHFYRTHHRWYFDAEALATAAALAGLRVEMVRHVHRYGMANALLWLRDRNPQGRADLSVINRDADALWRGWLEATGRSDNLYVILRRA